MKTAKRPKPKRPAYLSKMFKARPFSNQQLVFFALAFGLIGSWIVYRGFAASATYFISPTGNDSNPCSQSQPCQSFNRAYQVAAPGDTVSVAGGAYEPTTPAEGANKILPDPAKNSNPDNVIFICGGGVVTQTSPGDQFVITAQHVTVRGSCFNFNRLWVGDAPNGVSTNDVTIDGVSMMMFNIAGSSNVTIENSQVGPDIACYGPPVNDGRQCQNNAATNEKYFFDNGRPNTQYIEPMVHFGGPGGSVHPTSIQLLHNHFIRLNSRDINGVDGLTLHTSCLFLESDATGGPIVLDGNKFEDCMNIDTFFSNGSTQNVTLQNNMFGYPVNDIGAGASLDSEATGAADVHWKCFSGSNISNVLVRYNTFTHGPDLESGCPGVSYSNVRVIGNILGEAAQGAIGCLGNVIDYNIVIGGSCGTNSLNTPSLSSLIISRAYPIDFHLAGATGSTPADNYVAPAGGDYALATDYDSQPRAVPRDAGADERAAPSPKPGDLNGDGLVNAADLSILLSYWNTSSSVADINKDGTVNVFDLSILLSGWGT